MDMNTSAAEKEKEKIINVTTAATRLSLGVKGDGTLVQLGYGSLGEEFPPAHGNDEMVRQFDFYPTFGDGYVGEPALQVTHADGDVSTQLVFKDALTLSDPADANIITTEIHLLDPAQALAVTLFLRAFQREDVIQIWTRIENREAGPVVVHRYASAAPVLRAREYWLTQFCGGYGNEAQVLEERLTRGLKIIGSNLVTRAARMRAPMFMLSLDRPADDDAGRVIASSLLWPGSFQMGFDIDSGNNLRALTGANHTGGSYHLDAGQSLETPRSLWLLTDSGAGAVTQRLHQWARRYAIRQPERQRPVLLNNWEATGMKFDEQRLVALFEDARGLGIDVFLLDDGWFGNKYQRDNDRCGLGDWDVAVKKLPRGLGQLCAEARRRGFDFGIWLEPEMISPRSELFEQHPDWALRQPQRPFILGRNQLVLDLTRPAVAEFVWSVIDRTLRPHPIKFVKWDANSCVYQPVSQYLPREKQGNLDFEYNTALLLTMERMAREFPETPGMLCAGGGGRADYASLGAFTSFWLSDNTDPLRRVFIQWGFSYFFPPEAQSDHVTHMNNRPVKFAVDVALAGALGFDLDITKVSPADREFFRQSIELYKQTIRPLTATGDYYRLKSPYRCAQSATLSVSAKRDAAVLFVYQTRDDERDQTVRLKGLDAARNYKLREVSLPAGVAAKLPADGQVLSGRALMEQGLPVPTAKSCGSAVVLLTAVD